MVFWFDIKRYIKSVVLDNALCVSKTSFKGVLHTCTLSFEDSVYFLKKMKQLWTKYPMDLIRNVPINSKIIVLFQ